MDVRFKPYIANDLVRVRDFLVGVHAQPNPTG